MVGEDGGVAIGCHFPLRNSHPLPDIPDFQAVTGEIILPGQGGVHVHGGNGNGVPQAFREEQRVVVPNTGKTSSVPESRIVSPEEAPQAGVMKLLVREIGETNGLVNRPLVG